MGSVSESESAGMDETEIKIEDPDPKISFEEENNYDYHVSPITDRQNIVEDSAYASLWTSKATTCLIRNYKKYRSMVGQTARFRSLRDMFETISFEIQKNGYYFSPQKCENKWRVLERKYKNLILREAMKKPGRIKDYGHWEHRKALDEIFNETRKSVYLTENEYPQIGASSTKYALILPRPNFDQNNSQNLNQDSEATSMNKINKKSSVENVPNIEISNSLLQNSSMNIINETFAKQHSAACCDKIIMEMKSLFEISEKNKEKRHKEKIALRQNELEVQERLLKLKEKKFLLEQNKIIAMAQQIQQL